MLKYTNLHILNCTHVFPTENVWTCLLGSRGGSELDYVLVREYDASIVNTLNISPLSPDSNHKPFCLHIATKNSHIDQCIRLQKKQGYIMQPWYGKTNRHANEVESYVRNPSHW